MSLITRPLQLSPRLASQLDRLARTTRTRVLAQDHVHHAGMDVRRQEVEYVVPGHKPIIVHETVSSHTVQWSARPPTPAAYTALLLCARAWGEPSLCYEDTRGEYHDLTATWIRGQGHHDGTLATHTLLEHSDRGFSWNPLDVDDVVERAGPVLSPRG